MGFHWGLQRTVERHAVAAVLLMWSVDAAIPCKNTETGRNVDLIRCPDYPTNQMFKSETCVCRPSATSSSRWAGQETTQCCTSNTTSCTSYEGDAVRCCAGPETCGVAPTPAPTPMPKDNSLMQIYMYAACVLFGSIPLCCLLDGSNRKAMAKSVRQSTPCVGDSDQTSTCSVSPA
jgi:hypothetical protein